MDIFCQNRRQIFVNEVNRAIEYELMHETANLLLVVNEFTSLRAMPTVWRKICHIIFVKRVDPLHLQVIAISLSQHNFPAEFIMYARKKGSGWKMKMLLDWLRFLLSINLVLKIFYSLGWNVKNELWKITKNRR